MNGITPIQYGSQIQEGLANLAAIQQRNVLARQERYNEEFKQKLELMQLIDPKVLNQNLEVEISNDAINQVRENVRNFLLDKKNEWASVAQIKSFIQNEVGQIINWNNAFRTVKNSIDEQAKNLPTDNTVSRDLWIKAAKSAALFNNGKPKTLAELELDPTKQNWLSQTWNQNGSAFLRLDEIQAELTKSLNSMPKDKTRVSRYVGATAKSKGQKKDFYIDIPTGFMYDGTTDRVLVKRGPDGLIDQQVYTMFVGSPNSPKDVYFTKLVMDKLKADPFTAAGIIDSNGTITDQAAFDKLKRETVADYLQKFVPKVENDIQAVLPSKNETRVIVSTGSSTSNVGSTWMKEMQSLWNEGDAAKIQKKLKTLHAGSTKLENITYDGTTIIAKFKSNSVDQFGDPIPNEVRIPASDPDVLTKIAGLYQNARGADKGVEQFIDKIKVF